MRIADGSRCSSVWRGEVALDSDREVGAEERVDKALMKGAEVREQDQGEMSLSVAKDGCNGDRVLRGTRHASNFTKMYEQEGANGAAEAISRCQRRNGSEDCPNKTSPSGTARTVYSWTGHVR